MKVFRLLLASSFCLLCLFSISIPTEASTITIEELDINWRPRAISDCSTEAEKEATYAKVTITLSGVDFPSDPNGKQPYVTVSLSEVTNWKGICGNANDPDASTFPNDPPKPDLVLERTDSHNSDWTKNFDLDGNYDGTLSRTLTRNDSSISVKVTCKDYGAYGKITATLWDYAGAGKYKSTGSNVVPIPRDGNGNKIADGWENTANLTVAEKADVELDVETGPGSNSNNGDGLSIFAEYRGFKLYDGFNSRWQDTSPREKDIFVSWASNMSAYKAGDASKLPSPLKVNLVEQSYVNDPNGVADEETTRWLNFNNEGIPGHKKVYAINVMQSSTPPSSNVFGRTPHYGAPHRNSVAIIYIDNVKAKYPNDFAAAINNVIAHEIGHNVNLDDCPVDPCPHAGEAGTYCFMDWNRVRTSSSTIYGVAHNPDYDAHPPNGPRQEKHETQGPGNAAPTGGGNSGSTTNQNIISTNTGSSSYGCDYNAEYDYCTDTGTCTTRTDATGVGMCGHRWCCCPAAPSEDTSTSDDTTTSVDNSPDCDSCTTGGCSACPITYACGVHSGHPSNASGHSAAGCGTSGHYACDSSDHSAASCGHASHYACDGLTHVQEQCTTTNANGDRCTYTFWRCLHPTVPSYGPSHVHAYPAPAATCANGHTYNPSNSRENNRHRTRTCRWCSQTWQKCVSGAPQCLVKTKRNCWAIE